jgi:polysaccharide pyruvyl transferase WcaK-like protein
MLRELAEMMDFVTVRDQDSYDLLRQIGVRNQSMLVTADAALNTKPSGEARASEIWQKLGFAPGEEVLAVNVCAYLDSWSGVERARLTKEEFIRVYVRVLNSFAAELKVPLLFVSTQHLDEALTKEIMGAVDNAPKKALLSNKNYDHHEIKGVMAKVSMLFAMRLHCLILTTSALTPGIGLNYLPKLGHYFRTLGLEDCGLGFEDFSEAAIAQHLRKGWHEKAAIKAALEIRMPVLQRNAGKAAEIVAGLCRGEDAAAAIALLRGA